MKRKQIAFLIVIVLLAGVFAFLRVKPWSSTGQSQDQFEAALAYDPGRYHIVQIEVPRNDRGGYERRCVYAVSLLELIVKENSLAHDETGLAKAREIAKRDPRHRFNFKDPNAVASITGRPSIMEEACAIIVSGRSAFQLEYTGELKAGDQ